MTSRLMLDAAQLAYITGMGRDSTYQALEAGTFPAIRVGRTWRVPAHRLAEEVLGCSVEDIAAALAEKEKGGPAPQ